MAKTKTLVLCSGGLKSAFLTGLAVKEDTYKPILLFFDFGQEIAREQIFAIEELVRHYNCEARFERVTALTKQSSLLNVAEMFLRALPIAQEEECCQIYYGWSKDNWKEHYGITKKVLETFRTQAKQFFLSLQPEYDEYQNYQYPVDLALPLYLLNLPRIFRLGNEYDIPWHLTWSCEQSGAIHCGTCRSCQKRIAMFETDPLKVDTTIYLTRSI